MAASADSSDHSCAIGMTKIVQAKPKPKITICMLGPSASGKSELVKCLIRGNPYMSMGVNGACFVYGLQLDFGQPILLDVTECRGSRDAQLRDALARKPDVYFLLYDATEIKSFKEMRNKWLVSLYPKNVLTFVIGNKAETPSNLNFEVPGVSAKGWASGHLEISSITGQKVDVLIQRTAEIVAGLEVSDQTRSVTQTLTQCTISSAPVDTPAYYKMDTDPKGLCLIISIREFEDGNAFRYGTEKDEANLKELFTSFGFKVELYKNLKGSEINMKLKDISQRDHSKFSCFICVVMSHGTSKSIIASDGMNIEISELTKRFTGWGCEQLRGKPKVFFIQACRGIKEHAAHKYETDAFGDHTEATTYIPDEADFLIARSTVDGYVSYRNASTGSYYLNQLVDILKANPKLNLQTSLNTLHRRIADINFTSSSKGANIPVKQMPCYHTSLRMELVLG